jgi:transposase
VLEVLEEGATVTEVARRYGVARQTVHEWLARYASGGGLAGLADRSSRPESCPHQMSAVVEARVVGMRRDHPAWGPSRIVWELERAGVAPLPGRSSVYRALIRHGLVDPKKRRRRREDYRRWERGAAMELWQMDVMGRVHLASGLEVKVVTGIDDHSRFIVCAKVVAAATARPVCLALAEALRRHGIPGQILTDNGKVFTARFGKGPGPVMFDLRPRESDRDRAGRFRLCTCGTRRAAARALPRAPPSPVGRHHAPPPRPCGYSHPPGAPVLNRPRSPSRALRPAASASLASASANPGL